MDKLDHQSIVNLKSRFFDLFDIESKSFNYELILREMLYIIKNFLNASEVTYYSANEWNDEWAAEASTNPFSTAAILPYTTEMKNKLLSKAVSRKPIGIHTLEHYDLLIPLKNKDGFYNFFVVRLDESVQESNQIGTDCLYKLISEEFSFYIIKVQDLLEIVAEEKRYKKLFKVTETFHSSMDTEGVLRAIIQTLKDIYPSLGYYLLLSHDNNTHGDLPIKDLEYDSENLAAMEAYVTGEIQFEYVKESRNSILYAPLKGKQGVYGVLQVIAENSVKFPKKEVEFITLLANTAGGALENAQLYQQSKKLVSDLQLINEASHRLNSNLRLTEMMTYMSNRISISFEAEEVGFILFSSETNSLTVLNGSTDFFRTKAAETYIHYFKEKIKQEKDSLFLGDFSMPSEEDAVYKSIMAVPMMQTGVLKGFAIVMHQLPYHFSFDTFKLLQSLIHHSTLALTNSMLREELEKMVVTDHLTKLYSRSFLDEKLVRSLVEDAEGTFILIDIDNFKAVNDTYGHQVGDEIIIQVANIIMENIRATDIGARWGGEELAIYLPRVPLQVGVFIAERLVEKVRESSAPPVTISCGVSYWMRNNEENYHSIFKRADKALYIAKETGKDRVVVQDAFRTS
ncbi:sensor domain-containing diguanylate cyclase [Niallia taxi]|uniref:sensor domain-containing diguanylate cyclase n=1 Tax=Niallia taxi TaxID=2499688 RepID=UPI002E23E585|nr:sensor domain-containing diguanylate cyclase [Niallia taxi]